MGKISPISNKYIIYAKIKIDGVVERPDVIGAIFGQTEGLLGNDLELRELQRSGRIARIDVNLNVKQGKTEGEIIIPSSLDRAETAIVAAAIETITKIGPCDSKISVEKIEDVRVSKRNFLTERAKELLKNFNENSPESGDITNQVIDSLKMTELVNYGKDRLPAGPNIENASEIIIVEGRADVIVLLKAGIKNVIGIGGTSISETIRGLCKGKNVTVFVDGDRGGDLIIKGLAERIEIDFVAKAPDGKEVEELMQKEIIKALRMKIPYEQYKSNGNSTKRKQTTSRTNTRTNTRTRKQDNRKEQPKRRQYRQRSRLNSNESSKFKEMLDELVGTKGAFILNEELSILGKVPIKELSNTIKSMKTGIYAIVMDGTIDKDIKYAAEKYKIRYLVGTETEARSNKLNIITSEDLK